MSLKFCNVERVITIPTQLRVDALKNVHENKIPYHFTYQDYTFPMTHIFQVTHRLPNSWPNVRNVLKATLYSDIGKRGVLRQL